MSKARIIRAIVISAAVIAALAIGSYHFFSSILVKKDKFDIADIVVLSDDTCIVTDKYPAKTGTTESRVPDITVLYTVQSLRNGKQYEVISEQLLDSLK